MPYLGEIAALSGALFWGLCAILFESAGRRIGPFYTNLIRIAIAVLALALTRFMVYGSPLPLHVDRSAVWWLGASGVVGLAIGDGALFSCLVILGPRLATLLLSLAPPITALLAWITLGETLNPLAWLGIVLTIAGIFWVVSEKESEWKVRGSRIQGILLGLVAALGQGVGIILAKFGLQNEIDALSATLLRMVPAAAVLWLWAMLTGAAGAAASSMRDRKAGLATLGGAVFGPYIGVWLALVAVKYTEAGVAATLLATVPILIIPMVMIIHRSRPSIRAVTGTLIAVAGVSLLFLR